MPSKASPMIFIFTFLVFYQVKGKYIIKSGTDFLNANSIVLNLTARRSIHSVVINKLTFDSTVREDPKVQTIVKKYLGMVDTTLSEVIGYFDVELDGRSAEIRSKETNLGNFVADVMRLRSGSDVALLNSGTLRSDCLHGQGKFTLKDLLRILPLTDPLYVLHISGKDLCSALENGVSHYPHLAGRFPQVSGMRFLFNPQESPGNRVYADRVLINGHPLKLDKVYTVCVKQYLADGKDGYSMLANCPSAKATGLLLGPAVRQFLLTHSLASQASDWSSELDVCDGPSCELVDNSGPDATLFKRAFALHPRVEGRILQRTSSKWEE